jgi:hypothetical protein
MRHHHTIVDKSYTVRIATAYVSDMGTFQASAWTGSERRIALTRLTLKKCDGFVALQVVVAHHVFAPRLGDNTLLSLIKVFKISTQTCYTCCDVIFRARS